MDVKFHANVNKVLAIAIHSIFVKAGPRRVPSIAMHLLVIAGLDPAIHSTIPQLLNIRMDQPKSDPSDFGVFIRKSGKSDLRCLAASAAHM